MSHVRSSAPFAGNVMSAAVFQPCSKQHATLRASLAGHWHLRVRVR